MTENAEAHFNEIAATYDHWKTKNWYYYAGLKALCREYVPTGASVADIGCGTGDILVHLEPSIGIGIDVSEEMIAIARRKYAGATGLRFEAGNIEEMTEPLEADHVICLDVVEHVDDLAVFVAALSRVSRPGTGLLMSMINPWWESILLVAERLGMKMPEGPHRRPGIAQLEALLSSHGWTSLQRGFRLPVPKAVGGADWLNHQIARTPVLDRLGCVVFWHAVKRADTSGSSRP